MAYGDNSVQFTAIHFMYRERLIKGKVHSIAFLLFPVIEQAP